MALFTSAREGALEKCLTLPTLSERRFIAKRGLVGRLEWAINGTGRRDFMLGARGKRLIPFLVLRVLTCATHNTDC